MNLCNRYPGHDYSQKCFLARGHAGDCDYRPVTGRRFVCNVERCGVAVEFRLGTVDEPAPGQSAWRHVDDGSIVRKRYVVCRGCDGSGCSLCRGTGELEIDDHVASPNRGD